MKRTDAECAEYVMKWADNLAAQAIYEAEKAAADGEAISPDDARQFWHGLQIIDVPLERWTAEYYENRMEAVYDTMRGRDSEGMCFDAKPLTEKQAAAVIRLFDQYIDAHDLRLEVPEGCDSLYPSDEYAWCDICGAVRWEDVDEKSRYCRIKGGCSIRENYGDEP